MLLAFCSLLGGFSLPCFFGGSSFVSLSAGITIFAAQLDNLEIQMTYRRTSIRNSIDALIQDE